MVDAAGREIRSHEPTAGPFGRPAGHGEGAGEDICFLKPQEETQRRRRAACRRADVPHAPSGAPHEASALRVAVAQVLWSRGRGGVALRDRAGDITTRGGVLAALVERSSASNTAVLRGGHFSTWTPEARLACLPILTSLYRLFDRNMSRFYEISRTRQKKPRKSLELFQVQVADFLES